MVTEYLALGGEKVFKLRHRNSGTVNLFCDVKRDGIEGSVLVQGHKVDRLVDS